jgi:hypothetical protein
MFASLVIALIAVGVAIGAWFRPTAPAKAPSPPAYTDQQTAAAKTTVCGAFGNVDRALSLADARSNGSSDPTAKLAVATSTRQVLDFGSRYLLAKLAEQPATSPELASAIRKQADAYQEVLIGYLDGLDYSDPGLKAEGSASNDATDTIRRLCK